MTAIEDEVLALVEQIVAGLDDVAEFGADVAGQYREQRGLLLGLLNVNAMIACGGEIDEQHPQLVALRVDQRDRLQSLLAWAKETARM